MTFDYTPSAPSSFAAGASLVDELTSLLRNPCGIMRLDRYESSSRAQRPSSSKIETLHSKICGGVWCREPVFILEEKES